LAEELLGAGETVDGEGGEAEGTQGEGGLFKGLGLVGEFHEAAHLDAQHGDFVVEAAVLAFFEVFEIGGVELVGVEAVLEGVAVAAGCAATAAGESCVRGSGLEGMMGLLGEESKVGASGPEGDKKAAMLIIEQLFWFVKREFKNLRPRKTRNIRKKE